VRIATFRWKGRRHVGVVDAQAARVRLLPLSVEEARRGAQVLVEAAAAGHPLPEADGESLPLDQVLLEAPLPLPRRNLF